MAGSAVEVRGERRGEEGRTGCSRGLGGRRIGIWRSRTSVWVEVRLGGVSEVCGSARRRDERRWRQLVQTCSAGGAAGDMSVGVGGQDIPGGRRRQYGLKSEQDQADQQTCGVNKDSTSDGTWAELVGEAAQLDALRKLRGSQPRKSSSERVADGRAWQAGADLVQRGLPSPPSLSPPTLRPLSPVLSPSPTSPSTAKRALVQLPIDSPPAKPLDHRLPSA